MNLLFNISYEDSDTLGLGLYLKDIATLVPPVADLHEPYRLLQDLDEYEHLRHILRLCRVHFLRNIQQCSVPDNVRKKMRSLLCMEHSHWDATIEEIEREGGKAAKGIFLLLALGVLLSSNTSILRRLGCRQSEKQIRISRYLLGQEFYPKRDLAGR